jgi:hypothetical protein
MSKRRYPAVLFGPAPQTMLVTDVQPRDEWTSDKESVLIEKIEHHHADPVTGIDAYVRVHGRIIRGPDRSPRTVRTWTFVIDQELSIVRRP